MQQVTVKFSNVIIIDDSYDFKENVTKGGNGEKKIYKYTENGRIIYPFEEPIPIIRRGAGCIGLAYATRQIDTKDSTTVFFEFWKVDPVIAKGIEALYKVSAPYAKDSSDPYVNSTDAFIPGAIAPAAERNLVSEMAKKNKNKGKGSSISSLIDLYRDDDDDDR